MREGGTEGFVTASVGGFYTVFTELYGTVQCKPKGLFRNEGVRLLPGDKVVLQQGAGSWFIDDILPRKNSFLRPLVANIDQFIVVVSTVEPVPSLLVVDTMTVLAHQSGAEPSIVITKEDLGNPEELKRIYSACGYRVFDFGLRQEEVLSSLRAYLKGKVSVLCGNTGVGKSTLMNRLIPGLDFATAEISKKLGRGRHTTRAVQFLAVEGGWVADTPGFSSINISQSGQESQQNLQYFFPDIARHVGFCRFNGCLHLQEPGCPVRDAVTEGSIEKSRYHSYCTLMAEIRESRQYN